MKVKFRKNNKVVYWQDFKVYTGIPSGIEFYVVPLKKDKVKLIANGYGDLILGYGNGALYIGVKDLKKRLKCINQTLK
jgi:hypothetical protein